MKPYINKDMAVEIAIPMGVDHNGVVIDCRDFTELLVTAEWSGANAVDGTFNIEISNTGTSNWEEYPESPYAITTPDGAHHWDWPKRCIPFIRVSYKHGSNTTGLYAVTAWIAA